MVNPWLGMGLVLAIFSALTTALRMQRRSMRADPELTRKLLHAGMGLLTVTFPWLFGASWPVVLLAALFVLGLSALRISPFLRRHFGGVIDGVGRQSTGELCFPLAVGLLYPLSARDPLTFCIPMLVLSLADPAAALIGQRYGALRYPTAGETKSLEGSMAFLTVALLSIHIPLLCFANAGLGKTLLISLTVGLLLTLVEAMAVRGLDNLGIPLAAFLLLRRFLKLNVPALAAWFAVAIALAVLAALVLHRRILAGHAVSRDSDRPQSRLASHGTEGSGNAIV